MPSHTGDDSEEEDDDIGIEEGFQTHLDALKRACLLNIGQDSFVTTGAGSLPGTPSSVLEEDDEELFQSIQKKYFGSLDKNSTQQRRPVIISDEDDDDEDDEEILRSVEKLYSSNGLPKLPFREEVQEPEDFSEAQIGSPGFEAPDESSSRPEGSNEVVNPPARDLGRAVSTLLPSNWSEEDDMELVSPGSAVVPLDPYKQHTDLLSSAEYENFGSADKIKVIEEALQKNQSYQKRMRNILNQIESKQKHNAEMQRRVRTLVDFEKYCKKRFAVFFTDQANPSLKLFSTKAGGYQNRNDASDKNDYHHVGPSDNPDVETYKKLKQKAMFSSLGRKWRKEEREELAKGVKQQICEVRVCEAMDAISSGDLTGENALENALNEIRSKELTPQEMRNLIPLVKWDEVSRVYVVNRTPEECRTRWTNHEDPMINKSSWTKTEDKKLLSIAQRNETSNWEKVARELGTNRTPAECLTRYQRSLNAGIMRSNWTTEEDAKLRAAVEELGESDWSAVAACLEGRNNSQCLMRWYKYLHPRKQKKGRWSVEEDKRLSWAVSLHGARKWKQIANHVPGRTDIQCRERWCNVLNPEIKVDIWTEEEDQTLRESVARHGPHRWSAVASDLKVRTDKQCWRRWKILFPEDQPVYRRNVFIQRTALVNNFQGREKERPKLGPQDFVSKADAFVVPSKKVSKTISNKGKVGRKRSFSTTAASDQRDSGCSSQDRQDSINHLSSVRGALEEVSVNGDDALTNSKLRRLARIHKLKLARASRLASKSASKVPPSGAHSTMPTPDNQTDHGRQEATDPSSSYPGEIQLDKGKKRPRTTASDAQGKPPKRPRRVVAERRRTDTVEGDTQSASQRSQVESLPTVATAEPLSTGVLSDPILATAASAKAPKRPRKIVAKRRRTDTAGYDLQSASQPSQASEPILTTAATAELSPVTDGPGEGMTNSSTAEKECVKIKKRSTVAACTEQRPASKRKRPSKAYSLPGDSDTQTMSQEPQLVGPGPEIFAFVDLVHSVNDFCKYTSSVYGEQHIPALPDPEMSNTALTISGVDRSGGPSYRNADLCTNSVQERYLRSVHDHDTPFVHTESVSANGHGCRAERRMVASKPIAGAACDALCCPNPGAKGISVRSDEEGDANLSTQSNTESIRRGAQEQPLDASNGLPVEDEEVAAATRAILSWPFFYGVQQMTYQAAAYLDAKVPRKCSAARPPKPRKNGNAVPSLQLEDSVSPQTAIRFPVPKRPRSGRCAAKMRGAVQENTSDMGR